MRRLKRILLSLVAFVAAGYAYHTITNVTESDIAAYHKLDQQLGGFRAFPGDVVALSPDGASAQRICAFSVESQHVDVVEIDQTYVNSLGRVLPRFRDAWAYLSGAVFGEAEAAADAFEFEGRLLALKGDVRPGLPDTASLTRQLTPVKCECAMAARLLRRQRVCTVHGSLVDRDNELVWAIQFKHFSNFVTREQFEACGLPYQPMVMEIGSQQCNVPNLPWDAVMRNRLGLIEAEPRESDAKDPMLAGSETGGAGHVGF